MAIINLNYREYIAIFAFCPYSIVLFAFKSVVIHNTTLLYIKIYPKREIRRRASNPAGRLNG